MNATNATNAKAVKFETGKFYSLEATQKHSKEWSELSGYEVILRKQEGIRETVAIKLTNQENWTIPEIPGLPNLTAIIRTAVHQNVMIPALKAGYYKKEKLVSSVIEAVAYFEVELAELKLTEENLSAFFTQELRTHVESKLAGKESETVTKFCGIYLKFIQSLAKKQHGLTPQQVEQTRKLLELAQDSRLKVAALAKLGTVEELAELIF